MCFVLDNVGLVWFLAKSSKEVICLRLSQLVDITAVDQASSEIAGRNLRQSARMTHAPMSASPVSASAWRYEARAKHPYHRPQTPLDLLFTAIDETAVEVLTLHECHHRHRRGFQCHGRAP